MTKWLSEAVDVVCQDFSKGFDTVSHSTLLEKMTAYGLDKCTVLWVETGWIAEPKEW